MVVLKHKAPDGRTAYFHGVGCIFDKDCAYRCSNRMGVILLGFLKRIDALDKEDHKWELETCNDA